MYENTEKIAEIQAESKANDVKDSNVNGQEIKKKFVKPKDSPSNYIRVATSYFKKSKKQLAGSKDWVNYLQKWDKQTIKDDLGNKAIDKIEKYDGFFTKPSHLNYEQTDGINYNRYEPFEHSPKEGNCTYTLSFLKHIFGEHYEMGLEYLKVLLEKPTQILPILCLTSIERDTGKSTFLKWLKEVFGGNITINKNEDFKSQFNSDWTGKLIIAVDETLLNKREDSERIKSLSTANSFKSESKGKDKVEESFFGKFILCANPNETGEPFILVDKQEIRYWVLEVPTISKEVKTDRLLKDHLIPEIPAFLHHLIQLNFKFYDRTSRMWFDAKSLETTALLELKSQNKTLLEKEVIEILKDLYFDHGITTVCMTAKELKEQLRVNGIPVKGLSTRLNNLLKKQWGLEANPVPSSYKKYGLVTEPNGGQMISQSETVYGRYFEFDAKIYLTKEELKKLYYSVESNAKNSEILIEKLG